MKRLLPLLLCCSPLLAQSKVSLSWQPSTTAGTTVTVYRSGGGCSGRFVPVASGVAAAGPYVDGPFPANQIIAYQVTASLAGLESPPSNCVSIIIPQAVTAPPAAPTALSVAIPQ